MITILSLRTSHPLIFALNSTPLSLLFVFSELKACGDWIFILFVPSLMGLPVFSFHACLRGKFHWLIPEFLIFFKRFVKRWMFRKMALWCISSCHLIAGVCFHLFSWNYAHFVRVIECSSRIRFLTLLCWEIAFFWNRIKKASFASIKIVIIN